MQLVWSLIYMLMVVSINSIVGQSWTWSPPSIQTIDIYNESAVNISWQYSNSETVPSLVRLAVIIYKLNTTNMYRTILIVDGRDRFNFTSFMMVDNHFLKNNAYYAVILEYNTTYKYGINKTQNLGGYSQFKLFKMATAPIPNERRTANVTSNSAIISMMWPLEIPCFKLEMNAKLNDRNTTLPVETTFDDKYLINKYRFENLSPDTDYRLATTFKRRYLSNNDLTSSVGYTETIRTLKQSLNAANLLYGHFLLYFLSYLLRFSFFFIW